MIKKLTLVAAAVAAFAAFVVPASASAAVWQDSEGPVKGTKTVKLTGPAGFTAGTNGAHATLHAELELEEGSTGKVTAVEVTGCTGTGGLTGLTCDATVNSLPWTVHCNEDGSVTITGVNLTNHYTPSGLAPSTTLTGSVVATGEAGSLDKVSLAGEKTVVDVGLNQVPAEVTGSLEAETPGYSCA